MKNLLDQLSTAISMAATAHENQIDKNGVPYIFHPLELLYKFDKDQLKERIVAVLHDVFEDSILYDFRDLELEEFDPEIIDALKLLTRDNRTSYYDYIKNIKPNSLATSVKLKDLEHNTQFDRLPLNEPFNYTKNRIVKYLTAYKYLKNQINEEEFTDQRMLVT